MSEVTKPQPGDGIQKLAEWLKILADPTRLRIFNLLMQGVQCNCELGDQLQLPRNLISHHLNVLRQAGLVALERDAVDSRWVYYSINPNALAELNWTFNTFFHPARIQPRQMCCGPQSAGLNLFEPEITLTR